jgi:hypothetical protein
MLNRIFWALCSGSPRRYAPHTKSYNRFRRWTMGMGLGTDPGRDCRCLWRRCADDRWRFSARSSFGGDHKKATRIIVLDEAGEVQIILTINLSFRHGKQPRKNAGNPQKDMSGWRQA